MSSTVRSILLALAVATLAWALRARPAAPDLAQLARERGLGAATLAFDPDAAWRLRAVELALGTGITPRWDALVGAPRGTALPWPPLFTQGVAALARRVCDLPSAGTGQPLESYEEDQLEELAAALPPLLAALAALALFCAARSLGASERGALAAAALYAAWPADGRYGELDAGPWVTLSACVAVAAFVRAQTPFADGASSMGASAGAGGRPTRAVDVDRAGFALVAGLAGLVGAASASFAVVVLVLGMLSLAARASEPGELGRAAFRGALLAFAAALFTAFAATQGALTGEDALRDPSAGLPRVCLHLLVPLVVAQLAAPSGLARRARYVLVGLSVVPVAYLDPSLRSHFALLWDGRASWAWPGPALALGLLGTFVVSRRTPLFTRAPWRTVATTVVVLALCAGLARHVRARSSASTPAARTEREQRADTVLALRWMRTHTAPTGAWNHPRAPQDGGLLTDPRAAGWVAYHARRRALWHGTARSWSTPAGWTPAGWTPAGTPTWILVDERPAAELGPAFEEALRAAGAELEVLFERGDVRLVAGYDGDTEVAPRLQPR